MYFEEYDVAALEAEGTLYGDLSDKILGWASEHRKPQWFLRGKTISQKQAEEVMEYDEKMLGGKGYFSTKLWCHPDGIVGYEDSSTTYPEMVEYFRQWLPIAQEFPFLDLIFITLDNEGELLGEEWDLLADKIQTFPNEELDKYIDRAKIVTLAEYRDLLRSKVEEFQKNKIKCKDIPYDVEEVLHSIKMYYYGEFELAKISSQPEKLKKYFQVAILIRDGNLKFISDVEEMYQIYLEYYHKYDYDTKHGICHNREEGIFSKYTAQY